MKSGSAHSKTNWTNVSKENLKPFEQLSVDQQKVAIDLVVACSLIVTRLPSINVEAFKAIERDFAAKYDVPANVARYALRSLGQTLFQSAWNCMITKDTESNIATHFQQGSESPGGNGD